LGIRGQCLQDSPLGVRYTEYVAQMSMQDH
jgi:hypothetical protein